LENQDPETDLAKVKAMPAKAAASINNGNFEGWLGLLDENIQALFRGHKTLNGKDEIIAEMGKYWERIPASAGRMSADEPSRNPASNLSTSHEVIIPDVRLQ
jgi:hypothetical protein